MPRKLVLRTPRLALRHLTLDDAEWVRELFNDPEVVRYVGDRGLRTREDAERYLVSGPIRSYERNGFGLWRVEREDGGEPVGIAGLG